MSKEFIRNIASDNKGRGCETGDEIVSTAPLDDIVVDGLDVCDC